MIIHILLVIMLIEIFLYRKYIKNPIKFEINNTVVKILFFTGFIFSLLNFIIVDLYLAYLAIGSYIFKA